ncbi:MAG: DUF21 domain-containing protein [Phycisphaeraceae bacterium]|nr:DUF21 domain-containing protein [Phycisphaeraceae bacterium]
MDLTSLPIVLALLALTAASAASSASETALFGLNHADRIRLRRAAPRIDRVVAGLVAQPRGLIIVILLVNNIINISYYSLTSALVLRAPNHLLAAAINAVAVISLVAFGEVLPKLFASSARAGACALLAVPVSAAFRLLRPVRVAIERFIIAPLTRLARPHDQDNTLTVQELSALVELGRRQGAIDPGEQEVLAQVLQLGTLRVRDVMTPRTRVIWLDLPLSPERVAVVVASTRLTKIPVRRRHNLTGPAAVHVIGLLNTKRYLAAAAAGISVPRTTDFIEPVRYVPQTARLDQLLEHFRTSGTQFALCVSEHGDVVGSVKIEDVAERLVAELPVDEHGAPDTDDIVQIAPGRWLVPGRLSARDWAELFGQVADTRVTTVAGLVQARLGRIPAKGDTVEIGNISIEVDSVVGKVADRVLVSLAAPAASTEPSR